MHFGSLVDKPKLQAAHIFQVTLKFRDRCQNMILQYVTKLLN